MPALTPAFGTYTQTSDGYTVAITNYDPAFTWSTSTTTQGSISFSGTNGSNGLATISGVGPGVASTATIRTTRTGYTSGSATTASTLSLGTPLLPALTPAFGSYTQTSDGYIVAITNYDPAFDWSSSTTTQGSISFSGTDGSDGVATISGVPPVTTSTATIRTTRSGYISGSATTSSTASLGTVYCDASGNRLSPGIGRCQLGDVGPGGGIVFYMSAGFTETGADCSTNCHYLEWASSNWHGDGSDPQLQWLPTKTLINAPGITIGTGFTNTNDMATNGSPAALAVHLYGGNDGSQNKWFIPSQDELNQMYTSAFKSIGSFTPERYWTSSQQSLNNAYLQLFGPTIGEPAGAQLGDNVPYSYFVRPIRAF